MIVGAVKFEIYKAGWQRINSGRSSCCSWTPEAEFLPTQGTCVLCAMSLQSCPTLCDPMDCSPPGSSVHGILQTWILEWVAMPFSRGSSQPRDWTHTSCLLHWQEGSSPLAPPGKPGGHKPFTWLDESHTYYEECRKQRGTEEPLGESERGEWKGWLEILHSKN